MRWFPWRRKDKGADDFPFAWRRILHRNVALYRGLDAAQRLRLHRLILRFLDAKRFEGAGGMEITDEVRVTIAAQACLLVLGMDPKKPYPGLRTVIVYPSAYVARGKSVGPGGVVTEGPMVRAGESWSHQTGWGGAAGGPVVLAWDETLRGGVDLDGRNVTLHEFAHQLDGMSTGMDGAPPLGSRSQYAEWARTLGAEFEALRDQVALGLPTDLRAYGATNPAEFFAVATEAFFERPDMLRQMRPELFRRLVEFYRWTPS
ncbi:MAG: zinc-dependent peptidase [Phycisphaerales bacterium JB039]